MSALGSLCCRYAISNTRRGIESCGILAGTLSADDAVFTITTLIVPKQTGTTDTVRETAVIWARVEVVAGCLKFVLALV